MTSDEVERLKKIEAAAREMMAILEQLASEPDATSSLLGRIDRALAAARVAGLTITSRESMNG
jgi:hypothetical protein